jgi:hypothetical protein
MLLHMRLYWAPSHDPPCTCTCPCPRSPCFAGASGPSSDEARLLILVLHCLQRLASAPAIAAQIVGVAGGAGRIFVTLLSVHEHVALEAARLLVRLFAPAAARAGEVPWQMGRGGSGELGLVRVCVCCWAVGAAVSLGWCVCVCVGPWGQR